MNTAVFFNQKRVNVCEHTTKMEKILVYKTELTFRPSDYNTKVKTIKYIVQENGHDPQLVKNANEKLQTNNKETYTDALGLVYSYSSWKPQCWLKA